MRKTILAALAGVVLSWPASADASNERLARCIVHYESRGNPHAQNGQYHGIAQWSPEAWRRHGGHRYARDPLYASWGQQWRILLRALRIYGCRDWCPFDPC